MPLNSDDELLFENEGFPLRFLSRQPLTKLPISKAIILLHGVGSNENDLFGLANDLPDNLLIISPRAPFKIGADNYAWYQVDFSTGQPVINETQERHSRKILIQFAEQVKQLFDIKEICLGGFSQGAIMSYSVGLTNPSLIQRLVSLSGRILEEIKPLVYQSKELGDLNVFIAHGNQDGTLPVSYARAAKQYLQGLGIALSYHEYKMGHQVTGEVLKDVNQWLQEEIGRD